MKESIKKCPTCGELRYIPDLEHWAYKRRIRGHDYSYFCSWKCLRQSEITDPPRKKRPSVYALGLRSWERD